MKQLQLLLLVFCHFTMSGQGKEERLYNLAKGAEFVIEGHAVGSECKRSKNDDIYTLHKIRIDKIFKGSFSDSVITVFTRGGEIGNEQQYSFHGVKLGGRHRGILFLNKFEKSLFAENEIQLFEIYSNSAGVIRFNNEQGKIIGTTINFQFNDIEEELYKPLKRIVEQNSE